MAYSFKLLLLLVVVIIKGKVNGTPVSETDTTRTKRHLNNFGDMIQCETKDSKWKYNGYGCWCGFGGAGKPLDGTDKCCYNHDKCYDRLMAGNECTTKVDPYLVSYKFSNCSACAPASDYGYWDWVGWTTVACRVAICKCDSGAAKCFAQNVYNVSLASYDKSKCGVDTNA